jgi:tRNA(His) 5'-end guanylyltransferase
MSTKYSKDPLGERMKGQYESRSQSYLPRRTYSIIRLDGKAFHTYTCNLNKPFDDDLIQDMDLAVLQILPEIQGAQFAYIQSDEISILLTDFDSENTDAWFDGNVQKITSVSASLMTAYFNRERCLRHGNGHSAFQPTADLEVLESMPLATFDSRVFTIPDRIEVMNYFIWRNNDAARNSISMVAQSFYTHKELHGKSSAMKQEMIFNKGVNWNDYDKSLKNGRLVVREKYIHTDNNLVCDCQERTRWVIRPAEKFSQNKEALLALIPEYE